MDRTPEESTNKATNLKIDWAILASVAIIGAAAVWMLLQSGLPAKVTAAMDGVISAAVDEVGRES